MSEATNTKLMDTEPGGENTQYEATDTFVRPPKKSTGQFGDASETTTPVTDTQAATQKRERGEKTAENIRYGEAISEHGFGGETTGNSGEANAVQEGDSAEKTRREQGYGEGSGVGG